MKDGLGHATYALIILDSEQFLDDISIISQKIIFQPIQYSDEIPMVQEVSDIWKLVMYKKENFSYQNEFRFVFSGCRALEPFFVTFENTAQTELLKLSDLD